MTAVPSQVVVAAPPPQMVVAAPTYPVYNPAIVTSYSANSSLRLGIIQAVLGGVAFIVGCICADQECSSISFGYGIWSAIFVRMFRVTSVWDACANTGWTDSYGQKSNRFNIAIHAQLINAKDVIL